MAATIKQAFDAYTEKTNAVLVKVETVLEKHDRSLYGNGDIGMDEQLRNVWQWVQEQKREKQKEDANRLYYQRFLVGLLATNLITVVGAGLYWLVKIVPVVNSLAANTPP